MSRDGSITFSWADSEYKFRLAIGQIRELQEKADAGLEYIFNRLEQARVLRQNGYSLRAEGDWRIDDVIETIRLGLIGGGMEPNKARTLVQRYVGDGTFMDNIEPAQMIIAAALCGAPDEAPKKATGEQEMVPAHSPEGNGALPSFMETGPQ